MNPALLIRQKGEKESKSQSSWVKTMVKLHQITRRYQDGERKQEPKLMGGDNGQASPNYKERSRRKGEIVGATSTSVDMAESNPEGVEWPTQVDIPENDEQEETPEQTETDEHENVHIPAAMAKEIKEMISQEITKVQAATLSHLKEYFGITISQTIKEELIANFAGRVKEVTYSDFSACDPPSYSGESNPFLCHRWIQDVEGTFDTSKCPDNLRVKFTANLLRGHAKEWWNYTLATKGPDFTLNMSWNEFKELFLQKARFLPEYVNDQKLLMNHYADMLKNEIREFISAKDWKNMDELMNAALEQE
ncbi:hypothetical protein Tco_0811095 [Tanacetum coccineum]